MRTFQCHCGNVLFFDSTRCTQCQRESGWCDACRSVTSLEEGESGPRCGAAGCGAAVRRCANREQFAVCNCFAVAGAGALCRSCATTTVIPNLAIEGNIGLWGSLEDAKRRLLYQLDTLGLDYRAGAAGPPLRFEFKEDTPDQSVATGHTHGVITVNLREAKPVEREAAREMFGEPHRTLIGHMRHEVCHYFWMTLVQGDETGRCVAVFGDHERVPYSEAMPRFYDQGPPADWRERFISRYASAHPWEDFAETAAFYMDMHSVLETVHYRLPSEVAQPPLYDFHQMIVDYTRLGVILNEVNRAMGLTDVLPEVLTDPVIEKLRYVDDLFRRASG